MVDFNESVSQFLKDLLNDGGWEAWLISIAITVALVPIVKFILKIITGRIGKITKRTDSRWDDLILDCICQTRASVLFIWILNGLVRIFEKNQQILKLVHVIVLVATLYQIALWMFQALRDWRENFLMKKASEDASAASAVSLIYTIVQSLLIIALLLIGLSNLGVDIGALIAGLGVGGIAVALAAQNILGDLLASLSIVLDKPFVVGDYIAVGSEQGTVENIGIKTTRVKSLTGEQLIFSNKDLLESRVRNYKRMQERRVVQKFGIAYNTPPEKLKAIPSWVKEFISSEEQLRFERCHFSEFGESSLNFELVYWVLNPDFGLYMDKQQDYLLNLFNKFNFEKVEFAFPTRTLYIEKGAGFESNSKPATAQAETPLITKSDGSL